MVKFATHSDLNRRTHSAPAERGTWPVTGYSMQKPTRCASRLIAAATVGVSAIAFAPAGHAAPAETCLKAPHGAAPHGQHWYYRLERPSQRKCWYLAEKGRKIAQRARSTAQDEPVEEQETPAAPMAHVPAARAETSSTANLASAHASVSPVPAPEPAPVITTLVTRNVSNPSEIAQSAVRPDSPQPSWTPNSAPSTAAAAETAPAETVSTPAARMPSDEQAPAALAEQPPTAAATRELASASSETMPTLQLLLGAIALLGFVASGVFLVMALLRRRSDVLSVRRETNALPYEPAPEMAAEEEGPRFEPLRALDPIRQRDLDPMRQHDDVEEILQRLARRRRAA